MGHQQSLPAPGLRQVEIPFSSSYKNIQFFHCQSDGNHLRFPCLLPQIDTFSAQHMILKISWVITATRGPSENIFLNTMSWEILPSDELPSYKILWYWSWGSPWNVSSVNPSCVARGSFPWSLPIFLSPYFSLSKFSFVRWSPRTKIRTDLWVWKRFVGQMKSNFKLFESDGGENAVRWLVKIFWVIAIVISKSEVIYWFERKFVFWPCRSSLWCHQSSPDKNQTRELLTKNWFQIFWISTNPIFEQRNRIY